MSHANRISLLANMNHATSTISLKGLKVFVLHSKNLKAPHLLVADALEKKMVYHLSFLVGKIAHGVEGLSAAQK